MRTFMRLTHTFGDCTDGMSLSTRDGLLGDFWKRADPAVKSARHRRQVDLDGRGGALNGGQHIA
jgi:hypothetical protein